MSSPPQPSLIRRLAPWIALVLGGMATLAATWAIEQGEVRRLEHVRIAQANTAQAQLEGRMGSMVRLLQASAGFLRREGRLPNRQAWHDFVEGVRFAESFPGIQGLGFVAWVPGGDLPKHVREVRAEGFPEYRVHPAGDLPPDPAGCAPVLFLEPLDDRNLRAFGRDLWSEPARRAALIRARDTGLPTLTPPLTLVQEGSTGVQAGTLLFLPVYRPGPEQLTPKQRRQRLLGWAYYPIRMGDLVESTFPRQADHAEVNLVDSTEAVHPLFSGFGAMGESSPAELVRREVEVGGRRWRLDLRFGRPFQEAVGRRRPWEALALGLLGSAGLFALVWSLSRAADQAQQAVAAARAEFVASEALFTAIFELSPDPMTLSEMGSGRFLQVNPAWCELLGYRVEEAVGRPSREFDLWEDPRARDTILASLARGEVVRASLATLRTKSGQLVKVFFSARRIQVGGREVALVAAKDATALLQAQEALQQEHARFKLLVDASLEAIHVVDRQGRLRLWNQAFLDHLGITAEAAPHLTVDRWDRRWTAEEVRALLAGPGALPERFETVHERSDGALRQVEISGAWITLEGESLLFASARDVTDREASVRALRDSEARFRALFHLLPVGIILTDPEGQILQVNPAAERLLGVPSDDLQRRNFRGPYWEILRPDGTPMPPEEYASVRALREQRRVEGVEMGVRRPDGALTWLTVDAEPAGLPGLGVLIVFMDITARRAAQEALEASAYRLRAALEATGDGLWDWNPATNEVYFSPRWKAMLGFKDAEISATLQEWDQRIHPLDREKVYRDVEAHLRGETPVYVNEHRVRCKDGSYKLILDRGMVIARDAEGRPLRVVGTHTDLTERDQLAAAEARALKAEGLVLMAGSIAHDFNNLFQALQTSLDVAELRIQDPKGAVDSLNLAKVVLRRAVTLSWKMLDFSGRAVARLEHLDLLAMAKSWAPEVQATLGERHRLELDLATVPPILGDPLQLRKVLDALLENAREAMPAGGAITLRLFLEEGGEVHAVGNPSSWAIPRPPGPATVCLEVRDEGTGVAPEAMPRIFDPFFTTKELGRGLGLASVQGLLLAHGAGIHVLPMEGGGMTFRIHFPLGPTA